MGNKIIKIVLISLLFLNFISLSYANPQTIRIGWFTTDGGQFIDNNGNHSGYCYEYYQEIAKYTGWKYEYIPGTWQECLTRLQNGEIDVLAFVQYTPERAQLFDFTTQSMGESYSLLTAATDNPAASLIDFTGSTIGMLVGVTQVSQLKTFAAEHGFYYNERSFLNITQLLRALDNKEIDLALHHSARTLTPNEKVIAKFSPQPFYFAVTKGNTALRKQIDHAIDEIQINNPFFNMRLMNKYYTSNATKGLVLSAAEKYFLANTPIIRVVAAPSRQPLSYYNDDQLHGINAEILDKLMVMLGINYQFIPTKSYSESLEMIRTGQADIICSYFTDYSWAEQNNALITSPFMEFQYSAISRRVTLPEHPSIAALRGIKFNDTYLSKKYPDNKIVYYDTLSECINAINDGKQDLTFTNTYIAENYLRDYRYTGLMASTIPYSHYVSFATSGNRPTELCTVIDKALISLGQDEIKKIIAAHTVFQPQPFEFREFLYRNPMESIVTISLLGLFIGLLLFAIIRNKNKHAKEIQQMLFTDTVTHCPNYSKFKLESEKMLAENHADLYAVLYTDIQKFKYINDTLGREQGNIILYNTIQRIHEFLTAEEMCARVYADHFIILLKYHDLPALAVREAAFATMMNSIEETSGIGYKILFKIGIYLLEPGEYDIEKAVNFANYAKDTIPYVAENTYIHYDELMRTQIKQEQQLEASMHPALANREFVAYFQPRFDIVSKKIIGAEALVRWFHPQQGFMSPDSFIPFFEKNGFVTKLDLYMFKEVCRNMRHLLDQGLSIVPISSNFSRHHLNNANLPEILLNITKQYNIPPNMLEIEITETVATCNFELSIAMAKRLKSYGFMIAIDDFGSGYSSIQLLYKLPLDVLKIDKDYTQNNSPNQIEAAIMTSLINIAHANNIKVIFEGVENQHQENFVKQHACKLSQGYLYAKPMPFAQFEALLKNN